MREQLECIKSIWERLVFDANATGAVIIIPIKEKILAAIALERFSPLLINRGFIKKCFIRNCHSMYS